MYHYNAFVARLKVGNFHALLSRSMVAIATCITHTTRDCECLGLIVAALWVTDIIGCLGLIVAALWVTDII